MICRSITAAAIVAVMAFTAAATSPAASAAARPLPQAAAVVPGPPWG